MADGKPRFSPETDWKIWKGTFSFGLPFLALSLPRLRREAWGWKMFVDINGALHATGSNMVKREFEVRLRLGLESIECHIESNHPEVGYLDDHSSGNCKLCMPCDILGQSCQRVMSIGELST